MEIFPVYYFPPVAWFAAAAHARTLHVELHQHYRKQQYTSRMRILAPNKVLTLTVPVQHHPENTPLHEVRVVQDQPWQKQHWRSLETAYRTSAYFELYERDFAHFFTRKHTHLIQMNLEILSTLLKLLKIEAPLQPTEAYHGTQVYQHDYRMAFDPQGRRLPDWFRPTPYYQVFSEDFIPNLSILDLLFSRGPEAGLLLRQMYHP